MLTSTGFDPSNRRPNNSKQDTPAYVYTIDVEQIEECGNTCREVTLTLLNEGRKDWEDVVVDARLTAGGNLIYSGEEEVGDLASGKSYTTTREVNLSADDMVAVQQNDYVVTVRIVINGSGFSGVITQSIDIRNNETVDPPIPDLKAGSVQRIQHEGDVFLLIDNIPNQPPNRQAVTNTNYKLTSPERAKDVIAKAYWPEITWQVDWDQEVQKTKEIRHQAKTNKFVVKAASLGWDIGEIIILLKTGAALLAPGAVIEASVDVIDWNAENNREPYQEAFQGMTACLGNNLTVEKLASEVTSHQGVGEVLQTLFDASMLIDDSVKAGKGLAVGWKQMLSHLSSSGVSSFGGGVSAAYNASKGLFIGFAYSMTMGELESTFKTKADIHSLNYAFATQRLPLIKKIRLQHDLISRGEYKLGHAWQYYLNLMFDYQMRALVRAGNSEYYRALHEHATGFLWDITQNAGETAEKYANLAQRNIKMSQQIARIIGMAQTHINESAEQSINSKFVGNDQ